MKAYIIMDNIRKEQGKSLFTHYEYSFERDIQVRKRIERYKKQGYNVETKKDHWTTIEIIKK